MDSEREPYRERLALELGLRVGGVKCTFSEAFSLVTLHPNPGSPPISFVNLTQSFDFSLSFDCSTYNTS